VSTGSSKSGRSRQRQPLKVRPRAKTEATKPVQQPPEAPEPSDRIWLIGCILILLLAAFLRLYQLDLVPLHHDEGVNGNFLVRLVREGAYQYDPENYHGPTLYYFSAIAGWTIKFLFGAQAANTYGLNTVTIRLVTALFGLGTIGLVLTLRRRLGIVGTLAAATLLAVSPGAVYLARYFIHETLFVFFALSVVVAGLRYYEDGHPVYLVLAAASSALLFATKETVIINGPVLLIALVSTQLYLWWTNRPSSRERNRSKYHPRASLTDRLKTNVARLGGTAWLAIWSFVALGVFVGVSVLFYSSFFTNYPKGVYDSLRTFQVWSKTGQQAHVHAPWKYLEWLVLQESPVLLLGTLGAVISFWRPKNSFALFSALWAFGTLAAYSLIPYKTPWLTLNFIVPLALVSGFALQKIYDYGGGELRVVSAILLLLVSLSLYQTIDLNFFNYDNDKKTIELSFQKEPVRVQYYTYVYAHTRRETLALVDEIERIARSSREGGNLGITIVSPDYWPLPWYLRDYTRVGYFGRMTSSTEPVIVASESQRAEVQAMFGDRYQLVNSGLNPAGSYPLRPGVELLILMRRDLATSTPFYPVWDFLAHLA
jgi:uncharacterized protein (TIGR03663 family)